MKSAFQLIRKWFRSRGAARPPIHVIYVTSVQNGVREPENPIKITFVEIHT